MLNEPQASLVPQVTDHFTPALAASLVTITVSDTVASTSMAVGAAELKETAIGSGGVFMVDAPPHATKAALMLKTKSSKIDWRNAIP